MFPDLEAYYRINADHLTDRVRRVMKAAGFFDPEDVESEEEKKLSRGAVHVDRTEGLRRASVRDFHSFRVTWVTLALNFPNLFRRVFFTLNRGNIGAIWDGRDLPRVVPWLTRFRAAGAMDHATI